MTGTARRGLENVTADRTTRRGAGFGEPLAPEEKPENGNGQRQHDPEQRADRGRPWPERIRPEILEPVRDRFRLIIVKYRAVPIGAAALAVLYVKVPSRTKRLTILADWLLDQRACVDRERHAGDVAALVRAQEQDRVADVF